MTQLQNIIEDAWDNRELLKEDITQNAIREVVELLDGGTLRVAEPKWKRLRLVFLSIMIRFH